ncbi:14-3-3 domain-containing protein [Artemisia annua]|uniref:14-3-3 domain-containing protein n=1 Tax=Artemisia annua TaxID=35608 RepID=A0A2U1PUX9_ARTAN|nr:14-3-3 domain-containing protein [Artemisia annua]
MADTQKSRDHFLFIARLAEQSKRFDDMAEAMNSVVKLGVELTAEERNLLSVGYKNVLGAKRASRRILSVIKSKEEASGNMEHAASANESLKRVEDELTAKCNEILLTIDDYLLPLSKTGEAAVFYHKMKGDYYRYLAEFKSDADRQEATSQSLKAYEAATAIAESDLPPTNPIRLGLALNFSVFHYEIMANTERACNMAKQAFDDAAAELDSLDQNSYQDSTLILRLIGDNLTLWTPDPEEDEGEQNKAVDGVSGENVKDLEIKAGDE